MLTSISQTENSYTGSYGPLLKMTVLNKLRRGELNLVDQKNVTANCNLPRVIVKREALTRIGRIALDRAILELERRFCSNSTEEITGANVTISEEELVATLLDPRTVSCQHLTPVLRKRAMRLYLDKYITFAATAVRQNYVSHPLLPSPTKAKHSINKDSTIVGGFKLESGG